MGLDMYLSKKTYVKRWSFQNPEEVFEVSVKKSGVTYPNIKTERVSYITEEIMYWRKANQIHGWFVTNCEEVIEDVKYRVSREDLQSLLETCKQVLDILNGASKTTTQVVGGWKNGKEYKVDVEVYDTEDVLELLPPTQGFFFGSDEIDEWYKQNIEETIQVLEEELKSDNKDDYPEYEYYASW